MPQMAPIKWLILFFLFIFIFLLFNMMNYFTFILIPNKNLNQNKMTPNNMLTWKW